jgi:hypothetical protein
MTFNVSESSTWETNVKGVSTTDAVSGDSAGNVNLGLQDLANRTTYLNGRRFEDRKAYVERVSGNKCTLLEDDNGHEHLMYRLKKFNMSQYIGSADDDYHPAFYDNTTEIDEILVGVHTISENTDGDWVSDPGDNFGGIAYNMTNTRSAISSMGSGWHLMNIYEWAALALQSATIIQYQPGNTYNSRFVQAHNESGEYFYRGQPYENPADSPIYPGSGGANFSHDQTQWGVMDLVANSFNSTVGQFIDGIKLVDGQIYLTSTRNNNREIEASWTATGIYFDVDGAGGLELSTSSTLPTAGNEADFIDLDINAALKAVGNSIVDSKLMIELLLNYQYNKSGTLTSIDYLSALIGKRKIDLATGIKYIAAGGKTIYDATLATPTTNDAGLAAWETIDTTDLAVARACYIP